MKKKTLTTLKWERSEAWADARAAIYASDQTKHTDPALRRAAHRALSAAYACDHAIEERTRRQGRRSVAVAVAALVVAVFAVAPQAQATSGGLDSRGGHTPAEGEYHCHRVGDVSVDDACTLSEIPTKE